MLLGCWSDHAGHVLTLPMLATGAEEAEGAHSMCLPGRPRHGVRRQRAGRVVMFMGCWSDHDGRLLIVSMLTDSAAGMEGWTLWQGPQTTQLFLGRRRLA